MAFPTVSVIIPVRNEAKRIRQCIEGILKQTVPVQEIIVIDSGSTDGTLKILAEFPEVDVVEIDGASHNKVENVRDLIENLRFRPVEARYRIYIVDEVHMLSTAAFNALLKTLEEPPEHAKFILATTEPLKVPETIRSRCQMFDFRRLLERLE